MFFLFFYKSGTLKQAQNEAGGCVVSCVSTLTKVGKKRSKRRLDEKETALFRTGRWQRRLAERWTTTWTSGTAVHTQPCTPKVNLESPIYMSPSACLLWDCGRRPQHNPRRHVHNVHKNNMTGQSQQDQRSDENRHFCPKAAVQRGTGLYLRSFYSNFRHEEMKVTTWKCYFFS